MSCSSNVKFLIWMPMITITLVTLSLSYLHASPNLALPRIGNVLSCQDKDKQTTHNGETVVTRFEHMREVEDLGEAGDQIWKSQLLPPKGGFLWVETNRTDDIVDTEGWGITMFHALHCLQMIRELFKSTLSPEHASDHEKPGHNHADHDPKHATHCISYLYQVITCAGDGTLEPPQRKYDEQGRMTEWVVNGARFDHQCRDTKLLWDTVLASEKKPFDSMDWRMGDTVWDAFG